MADVCSQLIGQLRSVAAWPIPEGDLDELTYAYRKSEIQFLRNESAQIKRVLQLRPMSGLDKVVFIVDQGDDDLNRFAIRRIAIHFTTRPKRLSPRPNFRLEDMVFFVISDSDLASIAHFKGSSALTAAMAVSGPSVLSDCESLLEQVLWADFHAEDWSLDGQLYVRYDRVRTRARCTRQFVLNRCASLVALFDLAQSVEPISQNEEDRLFWYAQQGAAWAVERIVNCNLKLVFDVAYRYIRQFEACRVPFEDVFSGGIEGLMLAIDKYEVERGHRFASFAWQWIANRADRVFVESLWPVNVPYYIWERIGKACRHFSLLIRAPGLTFDDDFLAETLGLEKDLVEMVRLLTLDSIELVDANAFFDQTTDLDAEGAVNELIEVLSLPSLLGDLKIRQKEILLLRNGLHPGAWGQVFTLAQLADQFDLTRERVRQIELFSLKKLRQNGENVST